MNSCISACSKGNQWQRSLSILAKLEYPNAVQANIISQPGWPKADVISVNAALEACSAAGLWQASLRVFRDFCQDSLALVPDSWTYVRVISSCGQAHRWEAALRVLAEALGSAAVLRARDKGCKLIADTSLKGGEYRTPDTLQRCCNVALAALERALQWEQSVSLLRDMQCRRVAYDSISLNAATGSVAEEWQLAFSLLRVARSLKTADSITGNAVMHSCLKAGRWENALKLFAQSFEPGSVVGRRLPTQGTWDQDKLTSDEVSWATAVSACELAARRSATCPCPCPVWEPELAVTRSGSTENPKWWQHSFWLLTAMQAGRIVPDSGVLRCVIRSCGFGGSWRQSLSFFASQVAIGSPRVVDSDTNSCLPSLWSASAWVCEAHGEPRLQTLGGSLWPSRSCIAFAASE
ncbi:unnamed protein product, partial [Polarella glacialis]